MEMVKNAIVIWFIIKSRKTTLDVPYDTHGIALKCLNDFDAAYYDVILYLSSHMERV